LRVAPTDNEQKLLAGVESADECNSTLYDFGSAPLRNGGCETFFGRVVDRYRSYPIGCGIRLRLATLIHRATLRTGISAA